MALATINDVTIRKAGNLVRINIGGKSVEMLPDHAMETSNLIGNLAADLLQPNAGLPRVEQIHLRPFDSRGIALLRLMTKGGPLTVEVTSDILAALAAAAEGALEYSAPAGHS